MMDYTSEPPSSQLLTIQGTQPLNAEPPSSALVEFPITPDALVYCRNHGPVRLFDEAEYKVSFSGLGIEKPLDLSMKELKESFETFTVEAVLQCAGNRRREMAAIKPVNGILWNDGTIANCKWSGIRLCDVLRRHLPIHVDSGNIEELHLCFTSYATLCQDDTYYGSSIPLSKALDRSSGMMLAFEMNDDPLPPHHGGPVRLVAPGYLGARWVKWLDGIIISNQESPNYYQQRDYKVLPPHVETKAAAASLWSSYPSMTTMPLNSVICSSLPLTFDNTHSTTLLVKGYATNGHDSPVVAVDLSLDQGKSWVETTITYDGGKWGWKLWECEVEVPAKIEVVSRAKDASGTYQPKEGVWNLRGVQWCGWGRLAVDF